MAGATSWTESSLPRYLCSAFPLLVTAVLLTRKRPEWWTCLLAVSAATYAVLAVAGFTPAYTL